MGFADLLAAVRSGDQQAASELVRLYEPHVRRVIRLRLTDPLLRKQVDSLDVSQSVLTDFFVRIALGDFEIDQPEQLIALLAKMAQHKIMNLARRERAHKRDVRRLSHEDIGDLEIAASGSTPSERVAREELLAMIRARMSPEELHIAEQRSIGKNWAELAAQAGVAPDAIRIRYSRAVDRVAEELGVELAGWS